MRGTWGLVALAALGTFALACNSGGKAPNLPSSSGQAAYAVGYKEELASTTKSIADSQTKEKTLSAGLGAHVDELKKVDWAKVETIVDQSDQAGKSADFADASTEAAAVRSFWEGDKNDITAKVNGNAAHAMKQAGCSADASGAIGFALNDAIDKNLKKKLRSKNEASVLIERYKVTFGPQNTAALEKLADEVSEASYIANVGMVLQHNRLKKIAADKDDVKKTLDRFVADENAFQAEAGRTDAEKKASADRITAANKSKAEIDAVGSQADAVVKESERALEQTKKEYEEALKALKAKLAEKKKAEPALEKKAAAPAPGAI